MDRTTEAVHILLIEDDPGDVAYTRDVFADHKVRNRMTVIADGRQAVDLLRGEGPHRGAPLPDVVLLDLNLPAVDGRQLLRLMRADPHWSKIPIFVLTSSPAEEHEFAADVLPPGHYLRKPLDFDQLVRIVLQVDSFYLEFSRDLTRTR